MEDRYEIRGKIGHGGLGAVYRAFDRRMNREVALKRILAGADAASKEEAAKQLSEEAGALASIQHPHIVTVYDVGVDDQGPFVVMELITGRTLDDLVEDATLTWPDFHELALQTQEALIGAQELQLVHRDIKPGNVMLNWLPSGKFQIKIVDFGLAKFSPQPVLQEVGEDDSVLGSVFYMAPEQFERKPLDARVDMYSMGCLYYYALTGHHPFNGGTGAEVMDAHLQHRVFPLGDMRPDLPKWAVDWVMWHMNRLPEHRPQSARESLQVFLLNDRLAGTDGEVEEEAPKPAAPPKLTRPRRPGDPPEQETPPVTAPLLRVAPQPLMPPSGAPSLHADGPLTAPLGTIGSPLAAKAVELPQDAPVASAIATARRITSTQQTQTGHMLPSSDETTAIAQASPKAATARPIATGPAQVRPPGGAGQPFSRAAGVIAKRKEQEKKKRAMMGLGIGLLVLVVVLVIALVMSGGHR